MKVAEAHELTLQLHCAHYDPDSNHPAKRGRLAKQLLQSIRTHQPEGCYSVGRISDIRVATRSLVTQIGPGTNAFAKDSDIIPRK